MEITDRAPPGGVLDLFPPGTVRGGDGAALVAGCRLDELAEAYGTPALIVDEGHVRATARRYRQALRDGWARSQVTFASKAFPCTAVYRVMAEEGIWVDVVGGGELALALNAGVPPGTILLHGNAKGDADIAAALSAGVAYIVVDNLDDVERLTRLAERPQDVLLRVNPDVAPDTHAAVSTGGRGSKFGLPGEQLAEAAERVRRCPVLRLAGAHVHIGSQILDTTPFVRSVTALAGMLGQAGIAGLAVYDLGGGLAARYTRSDDVPEIEDYVSALVAAARRELPPDARILIEPGRSMVAAAGLSLYRVVSVKRAGKTFVAVDGGMGDNLEVSLYGQRFEAALVGPVGARPDEVCDVVGHHCESGDRLVADAVLPRPEVGDLLAVPVTGAYTYSLSNNYNGSCRPPVVFVRDGRHRPVVRRETLDDLIRRDLEWE